MVLEIPDWWEVVLNNRWSKEELSLHAESSNNKPCMHLQNKHNLSVKYKNLWAKN